MSIAFRDLPVYDLTGATRNFEQLVALKLTGSLEGTLDEPILKKPEAFKLISALGYKNSWEDFEAGRKGEYRKNPFGVVELRGIIKGGASGTEAFTLPEGYRPKTERAYLQLSGKSAPGFIGISTAGVVKPTDITGEVKAFVYLEASFSVE